MTRLVCQRSSPLFNIAHVIVPFTVNAALKTLYIMEALDAQRQVTPVGRAMNLFPLEPQLSRALFESRKHGCTREVLAVVSLLSASAKVFYDPGVGSSSLSITNAIENNGGSKDMERREEASEARAKFAHSSGDHMTLLNVFRAYQELVESSSSNAGEFSSNASTGVHTSIPKSVRAERREWCKRHYLNERALNEALDIQAQLRRVCEGMSQGNNTKRLAKDEGGDVGDDGMSIDWRSSCAAENGSEIEAEKVLRSLLAGLAQHTAFLRPEGGYRSVIGSGIQVRRGFLFCLLIVWLLISDFVERKDPSWVYPCGEEGTCHYIR